MKPAISINSSALGDTIAAIPTINKLSKIYEQPITVFTSKPFLFVNHPSVLEAFQLDKNKEGYEVHHTFSPLLNPNNGVTFKHAAIDIRQFHAMSLGFTLNNEEMNTDLYVEKHIDLNGYSNYVVIHPTTTWASRTWDTEKWQSLINKLNDDGIPVIAIGRQDTEMSSQYGKNVEKPVMDIDIKIGINMLNDDRCCIGSLRWILKNAMCVITMDSGILHVAGSTDVEIIQLGSSIDNKLRAPFRKGTQSYKYKYIGGSCNVSCASNLKYYKKVHGNIHGIPPLRKCLEGYDTFRCHPIVNDVYEEIKKLKNKL